MSDARLIKSLIKSHNKRAEPHQMPDQCENCPNEMLECDLNWSFVKRKWLCDECHDHDEPVPEVPKRSLTEMLQMSGFFKMRLDGVRYWAKQQGHKQVYLMWKRYKGQEVLRGLDYVGRYDFDEGIWNYI